MDNEKWKGRVALLKAWAADARQWAAIVDCPELAQDMRDHADRYDREASALTARLNEQAN